MMPWVWPLLLSLTVFLASGFNPTNPVSLDHSDKVVHFLVFGLIAIMVVRIRRPTSLMWALVSFFIVSAFGALDEFRQSFALGRNVGFVDWLADTLGAGVAVTSYKILPWLVEITKTGLLEKLVWAPKKDPDNEIKTIHNRTEDPHPSGC
jgi:VanZ family protein